MNLHLVDFHCFGMLQFQYFSSTARFSDSTYIDAKIVVFHLFCNCTIWKHRKSTESEKRNWELRNIKPAPKSFEIYSKSFAYVSFSLLQMMKSLSLLALVAGAIAQKPARWVFHEKHCQRHNGPKALSTLTHLTPLVQAWESWSNIRIGFKIL